MPLSASGAQSTQKLQASQKARHKIFSILFRNINRACDELYYMCGRQTWSARRGALLLDSWKGDLPRLLMSSNRKERFHHQRRTEPLIAPGPSLKKRKCCLEVKKSSPPTMAVRRGRNGRRCDEACDRGRTRRKCAPLPSCPPPALALPALLARSTAAVSESKPTLPSSPAKTVISTGLWAI